MEIVGTIPEPSPAEAYEPPFMLGKYNIVDIRTMINVIKHQLEQKHPGSECSSAHQVDHSIDWKNLSKSLRTSLGAHWTIRECKSVWKYVAYRRDIDWIALGMNLPFPSEEEALSDMSDIEDITNTSTIGSGPSPEENGNSDPVAETPPSPKRKKSPKGDLYFRVRETPPPKKLADDKAGLPTLRRRMASQRQHIGPVTWKLAKLTPTDHDEVMSQVKDTLDDIILEVISDCGSGEEYVMESILDEVERRNSTELESKKPASRKRKNPTKRAWECIDTESIVPPLNLMGKSSFMKTRPSFVLPLDFAAKRMRMRNSKSFVRSLDGKTTKEKAKVKKLDSSLKSLLVTTGIESKESPNSKASPKPKASPKKKSAPPKVTASPMNMGVVMNKPIQQPKVIPKSKPSPKKKNPIQKSKPSPNKKLGLESVANSMNRASLMNKTSLMNKSYAMNKETGPIVKTSLVNKKTNPIVKTSPMDNASSMKKSSPMNKGNVLNRAKPMNKGNVMNKTSPMNKKTSPMNRARPMNKATYIKKVIPTNKASTVNKATYIKKPVPMDKTSTMNKAGLTNKPNFTTKARPMNKPGPKKAIPMTRFTPKTPSLAPGTLTTRQLVPLKPNQPSVSSALKTHSGTRMGMNPKEILRTLDARMGIRDVKLDMDPHPPNPSLHK